MQNVICLMGPTASGKTDTSFEIAERFPVEIISVDSAMIYKTMDIGTAKPTLAERQRVPHHLIDILDPAKSYSVAKFCKDTLEAIQLIYQRGKIPLLVGGTMLYFKSLQTGLSPLPAADPEVRMRLSEEAEQIGWPSMHERLKKIDPRSADRINLNDPQRILRALEVWDLSGRPMSEFWQTEKEVPPFNFINLALIPEDRSLLHTRIEKRFHKMLEQGFVEEVLALFRRGDLHSDLPSIRSVGYRQIWQYLEEKITYAEMIEKGIAATRQLAKRQLTWLRNWPGLIELNSDSLDITQLVVGHIQNIVTQS